MVYEVVFLKTAQRMSLKNIGIKNDLFIEILKLEKRLFPLFKDLPSKDPRLDPNWTTFISTNKRFNAYLKIGDRVFAILLLKKAGAGNEFIGYKTRYEIQRVRSEKDMPHPSKEILQVFFLNEK